MDDLAWGVLLAARMFPAMLLLPACGGGGLPLPARIGLTAALVLGLVPALAPSDPAPCGLRLAALLANELLVGAVLAFAAGCAFAACEMGGRLLDEMCGAARHSIYTPFGGDRQAPLSLLHLWLAVLFFFGLGGPGRLLEALRDSLRLVPLGGFAAAAGSVSAGEMALRLSAAALEGGLGLALPAATCLLCADLVLGFAGRLAPGLPVYFVGLPLKVSLALAAVALSLPAGLERAWISFGW